MTCPLATVNSPGQGLSAHPGRQRHPVAFRRLDAALLAALLLGAALLCWRLEQEPDLQWKTIWPYVVRPDGQPGLLLLGLQTTLRLTLWAGLVALVLGLCGGLARTSQSLYLRLLGGTYVELCRNLPPLVLIFLCYYFLADQIAPVLGLQNALRTAPDSIRMAGMVLFGRLDQVDAFLTATVTLGLYEGAYVAEIVRGAIQSVPRGQWEAGSALGFPRLRLLRHIILPQAARTMLPPLTGQAISTIKDSAIVSVISIQELTFQGMQIMSATYLALEVWTCVALLYFTLTFTCSLLAGRLETRMRRRYSI